MEENENEHVDVLEVDDEVMDHLEHIHDWEGEDPNWEDLESEDENEEIIGDPATLSFTRHLDPVVSCGLDPSAKNLVISGGQDNMCYVWDLKTGDVVMDSSGGHNDTVLSVGFSHDGKYAASGDMSGRIIVWDVEKKERHWQEEVDEANWLLWHPQSTILSAGTKRGDVWLWAFPGQNQKVMANHGVETEVGRFFPDGKRGIYGFNDGAVKVFDLKEGKVVHSFHGQDGHSEKVVALDCHPENNMALSGSVDGTARLISSQTGKVLAVFNCDTQAQPNECDSVETVAFCPTQPWAAVGTLASHIHIWDIATQKKRVLCENQSGITRMLWHHTSPLVCTGDVDGALRLWDPRTGNCERTWLAHRQTILDLQITNDGKYAVTAADDNKCCVFTIG